MILGLSALVILALVFVTSLRQIRKEVGRICRLARQDFPGDDVEALIALMESNETSFRDKNRAIWALGQLGDKRALPVLNKLDTDEIQEPPYDANSYIVQYTVEKAIKQINSEFILTRWMYGRSKYH